MAHLIFERAIRYHQIEKLTILLSEEPDIVNKRNSDSTQSWLELCFETNDHDYGEDCECVELLVNHGANINERYIKEDGFGHEETPVMWAVNIGCLRCLEFLIKKGADLSLVTSDGDTALLRAVKEREFENVQILIQHSSPALINHRDGEGKTALLWAAECQRNDAHSVCEQLIEAGADLNITYKCGQTALMIAVMSGTRATVDTIIRHSTSELINLKDIVGRTALMRVLECGREDALSVCQQLIEAGADVNIKNRIGETALIFAVKACKGRFVNVLIQHSTSQLINHTDNVGRTALMWAAECHGQNAHSLIQKLIEAGADVNIRDTVGQTALMWSAECHGRDAPSLCQQLIEAGTDVNITDNDGSTALILAVKNWAVRKAYILIQHSTPQLINHRDNGGRTALMRAAKNHGQDAPFLLQILIEAGADVNIPDENGQTALIWAAECHARHTPFLIQKLIEAGADVNISDKDGQTALMWAAECHARHTPSPIQQLIEAGADVNITDTDGNTALIHAVKKNKVQNALVLIQHSTSKVINHRDNGGRSALMWAILKNCNTSGRQRSFQGKHRIESGADVNLRSNAFDMKRKNVVSFLLEKGAISNMILINGKTPLYEAFKRKNLSLLNQLFIEGADPTLSLKHTEFIHQSIANNTAEVLHTLVLNGFPPLDCTFSDDRHLRLTHNLLGSASPLSFALWENQPAMAHYLITNKFFTRSDINQTLAQNTELRQRLTRFRSNKCLQILEFHLQTVQTLSTLCLVTISSALTQDFREINALRGESSTEWRFTPTFKERVESLGLLPKFQIALLYQC